MEHNACTGISDVRYFSPRLLAALTGILSSPLTVIEAPMGYGKTVAVREFLRRSFGEQAVRSSRARRATGLNMGRS